MPQFPTAHTTPAEHRWDWGSFLLFNNQTSNRGTSRSEFIAPASKCWHLCQTLIQHFWQRWSSWSPDYATDVVFQSFLPWFFYSRVVFLFFHPFLVSVPFTGPSLLLLNFYRNFFIPTTTINDLVHWGCAMAPKPETFMHVVIYSVYIPVQAHALHSISQFLRAWFLSICTSNDRQDTSQNMHLMHIHCTCSPTKHPHADNDITLVPSFEW